MKKSIIIILTIILVFNFIITPVNAEPITIGISMKVLITLLSSMGVLYYVNENIGFDTFYNEFIIWADTVKGYNDMAQQLYQLGYNSIIYKTKLKVKELKGLVKEFYISKFGTTQTAPLPDSGLTNLSIDQSGSYTGKVHEMGIDYTDNMANLAEIDLGSNYILKLRANGYNQSISTAYLKYFEYRIFYNGEETNILDRVVTPMEAKNDREMIQSIFWEKVNPDKQTVYYQTNYIRHYTIAYRYQMNESGNHVLQFSFQDISNNVGRVLVLENFLPNNLVAELELPELPIGNIPLPQVVPNDLPFPWNISLDLESYKGKTINELLEGISAVPLPKYIEDILDIPKPYIDAYPNTEIEVDEQGKIKEIKVPEQSNPLPELVGISGILSSILSFIKSIFEIPDDLDLDLDPLKNLIPKDKFPFSLPWDLYSIINILKAEPKAPYWELKIMNESIIIDMSQFESWAKISRNILSITYVTMLIFSTKRIMGGGS